MNRRRPQRAFAVGGVLVGALALALPLSPLSAAIPAVRSLDLLTWSPGKPRAEIDAELASAHFRPIRRGESALILETPVLTDLFARQRALLEFDSEQKLSGITVHLLPEQEGAGEELLQLYEDARDLLLDRLGAPGWSRESGRAVSGQTLRALADGSIVRCLEWSRGRIVRLGIPRRGGSEPRVEIRVVASRLPAADGAWGQEF